MAGGWRWRSVLPAFVNDPFAWVKDVRPFLVEEQDRFRSDGPDALTSRRYAREFNEVKRIGFVTSTAPPTRPTPPATGPKGRRSGRA